MRWEGEGGGCCSSPPPPPEGGVSIVWQRLGSSGWMRHGDRASLIVLYKRDGSNLYSWACHLNDAPDTTLRHGTAPTADAAMQLADAAVSALRAARFPEEHRNAQGIQ